LTIATHYKIKYKYKINNVGLAIETCSKLVADRFEAKFNYASIWSQTGPKLVADLSQIC